MPEHNFLNLPPKFVRTISGAFGEEGKKWLKELPGIAEEIAAAWNLTLEKPFAHLSYHFVAPCTRADGSEAVLKMGFPGEAKEFFNEVNTLRLYDAKGAVKLFDVDEKRYGMLLEKLTPGKSLVGLCRRDDEQAVNIAARILKNIIRKVPAGGDFHVLENWVGGFRRAGDTEFLAEKIKKARSFYEELTHKNEQKYLLHGDFHHENILSAEREEFLVIDPKGLIGDTGYDIGVFLNNHRNWLDGKPDISGRLDSAIDRFSEVLTISRSEIRKWAYLQMVLSAWWTFEENDERWKLKPKFGRYNSFMSDAQFGMIGLGTMGRNFLLNTAGKGYRCIGYDPSIEKQKLLLLDGAGLDVAMAMNLEEFVRGLKRPRNIMLLVPAGRIVDEVIEDLLPLLEPDDLVIDGGNSHFPDTGRREKYLNERGLKFLGVGVSGGEEGALHGASIMAGGDAAVYERIRPLFEAVSAKVKGEPCAAYMGTGSAGHFVKMVHNGIEYGLMQLIAETFDLMQRGLGLNYEQIADVFAGWNKEKLNSFLIEITEKVLRKIDDKTGKHLVEMILDTAGQKGTGKWTSQAAMDLGVPVPTIDSAVTMRQLSAMKKERLAAGGAKQADSHQLSANSFQQNLRKALQAAFILTYAQGLSLLQVASEEMHFGIDVTEVAKIWRGGCIIRAALLEDIRNAFAVNKELANLMLDKKFAQILSENVNDLRKVVAASTARGFPSYCLMSCLAYYDAYHAARLPANLIQAQRDFFGAHTYQRIDEEGIFHTPDWDK